jgi:hypothetical protein
MILFLLPGGVAAQYETGTMSGTATDSSGGALPDTKIEAKNVGTNATQTTMSDAAGRYRIPDLPLGHYDIEGLTGIDLTIRVLRDATRTGVWIRL